MYYEPDIGFHGNISVDLSKSAIQFEPSLTLCEISNFGYWGGLVSHQIFKQLALSSAFQRLAARAESDPNVSIRISTYTVWLEAGEVPSARPDWHIDRVGALRRKGVEELVDLRDPFKFPSYILTSFFIPADNNAPGSIDDVSTEFLLSSFSGSSPELWANMDHMHLDIDTAFSKGGNLRSIKAGNSMLVSFSPRTVHRPGQTTMPGWRYLMRVGLYTTLEPCSPYRDHFVFFNPAWSNVHNHVSYRKVGCKNSLAEPTRRSVPLIEAEGRNRANSFVEENDLAIQANEGVWSIEQVVADATFSGNCQLKPCLQVARDA